MRSFVVLLIAILVTATIVTGLMAFLWPFDIVVTRIHAATAPVFALLVVWHVVQNRKPFARYLTGKFRRQQVALVACVSLFAVVAYGNFPPINWWMAASYENRQAETIFRPPADVTTRSVRGRVQVYREGESVPLWIDAQHVDPNGEEVWMAIWMENDLGEMLDTLYLSESLAFVESVDVEGIRRSRADLLPYWATQWEARRIEQEQLPTTEDAVTKPSPQLVFDFDSLIRSPQPRFNVLIEIRRGEASAQVYTAMVDLDRLKKYYLLDLLGISTKQGTIRYDTADLELKDLLIDRALVHIDDQRRTSP